MTHLSDDDLVLLYYRDPSVRWSARRHLDACPSCAARHARLHDDLAAIPGLEPPARDERYGLDVWQRIRSRLPERATGAAFGWIDWRTPAVAASLAVAVVAVWSLGSRSEPIVQERAPAAVVLRGTGGDAVLESRRILLMSVADHLERSDRVLTDIINAPAGIDISVERGWAEDLLWTGRIYRQNALEADERSVAAVLDDLERTLLDIVHAPPALSESQLHAVRARVESGALLFKVRVLRDDLTESGGGAVRIPRDGVEVS